MSRLEESPPSKISPGAGDAYFGDADWSAAAGVGTARAGAGAGAGAEEAEEAEAEADSLLSAAEMRFCAASIALSAAAFSAAAHLAGTHGRSGG